MTKLFAEPLKLHPVEAQLVSEVESIQPGKPFWVAVRLKMDEHWHTYWRNPGDSGLPTKIEWKLPEGFVASGIEWPCPQKIDTPPLVSFGYEGEVFLLTKINAPKLLRPGSKVKLAAKVEWLVCKEVCIPGHADLKIEIPVKIEMPKVDARWVKDFAKTRKNLPITIPEWKISAQNNENQIIIQVIPPSWFKDELSNIKFFPEQTGIVDYSAEQKITRTKDGYKIEIKRSQFSTEQPNRLQGVLVSEKGWRGDGTEHALQINVPIK